MKFEEFEKTAPVFQFELEYREEYKFLERAISYLLQVLDNFNEWYGDEKGEVAYLSGLQEARAKDWKRLKFKIWEKLRKDMECTELTFTDVKRAYSKIHDLAGGRIAIRYFDKVPEKCGDLQRYLVDHGFTVRLRGIPDKNYLKNDKQGYRAYHMYVRSPVKDKNGNDRTTVFEIQVRTAFQHIWAVLSHPLVYEKFREKEGGIPELIIDSMQTLSSNTHAADRQLVTVRKIVEERERANS